MGDYFLGEIKMTAIRYAQKGWAFCNGQLVPVSQNQALFSLLGTTFGGDGQQNFGLPNYQGNVPVHVGPGFALGQAGGEAGHALSIPEMPAHTHRPQGTGANGASRVPGGNLLAKNTLIYGPPTSLNPMGANATSAAGGGVGHQNMQPYLPVAFVIALTGIYPSRN